MKKLLIVLILATGTLTTIAQTTKDSINKAKTAKVVYTCPMHPEVTSAKPGKCPKCGMTLVKKTSPAKKAGMEGMKMDTAKH